MKWAVGRRGEKKNLVMMMFSIFSKRKTGTNLWLKFTSRGPQIFPLDFPIFQVFRFVFFGGPTNVVYFVRAFRVLFSHKSSHLIAIISSSQKLAITKNSHRKILTFSYGRQSNFENVCLSKTNGVSNNMEVQQVLGGMFIGLLVCLCAPRYGA